MTDIDRDLTFGLTMAIGAFLVFGVTGIIAAIHGHVIIGSTLVACQLLSQMVLVARR